MKLLALLLTIAFSQTVFASYDSCKLYDDSGLFAKLDYKQGTLNVIESNSIRPFINAAEEYINSLSIERSSGAISTNTGMRSNETGERASQVIVKLINNQLNQDYDVKCEGYDKGNDYY